MKRLPHTRVPQSLKEQGRTSELMGEIKNGGMVDCVYNGIICGDYEGWQPAKTDVTRLLPFYPQIVEGVEDKLKLYQVEDLNKSLCMSTVFNINKPGYGKTLETILWIKLILKYNFKALILCPKSVIGTWEAQLRKYWPGYLNCGIWWITNYEQLINKEVLNRAAGFVWDVIVLDESHKIKSMKSKINQAVFSLTSLNRHCLTGTPIKNRPQDLAAQLKWLDPNAITNYTDFQFAFCNMEHNAWGFHSVGLTKNKKMVDNLQQLLNMYCVGGQEHDIGTFGQPEYIKIRLKLDPKVKDLYKKVEGEYDQELKQRVIDTEGLLEQGVKVTSAIESAVRRQQLTSNPQLFDDQLKNVKFEWISDWLDGTDEKVVIFSKYAQSVVALEKYLVKNGYTVSVIRKEQSPYMRGVAVDRWKKECQVLLGTFGVMGQGVDGLQDGCHYVIFLDREWTASDNEQAEKRIWRIGQKYQPIFYILQAIGTIDVRIERVQLDKGHDARELLDPVTDDM